MLAAALIRFNDDMWINQVEDCVIAFLVCLAAVSVRDYGVVEERESRGVLSVLVERLMQVGWILVIAIVHLFGKN